MNRQQVLNNLGEYVRLDAWPFKFTGISSRGVDLLPFGVGERWVVEKLTKGGMAMISKDGHTLSVPPFYLSELK